MSFSPITHPDIFDQIIAAADLSTRLALAATCWRLRRLIAPYNHLVLRCLGDGVIDVRAAPTWKLERATDSMPDGAARVRPWERGTLDNDGVLPEFPPMVYSGPPRSRSRPARRLDPAMARCAALLANTRIVDVVGPVYDFWLFCRMENLRTMRLSPAYGHHQLMEGLFPFRLVTPQNTLTPITDTGESMLDGDSVVRHVENESDVPRFGDYITTILVFHALKAEWKRAEDPDASLTGSADVYSSPFILAYVTAIYPHVTSTAAQIWIALLDRIGPQQGDQREVREPHKWVLVGLHDMDPGVFFPISPNTNMSAAPNLEAELRAVACGVVELEFFTLAEYNSKYPFDLGHWPAPGVEGYFDRCDCHSETD